MSDMQKLADTLATESRFINNCVQAGDHKESTPGPLKSVLEKALDEVSRGNPEEAERLIELALLKDADTGVLIAQVAASLKDVLSRFRSCIAQGNGEIEGDRRAIAQADAILDKATGGSPIANANRADRAESVLRQYVEAKNEAFENSSSEAADLIADLLHLVARTDQGDEPIESTLRLARLHFDAEHGNPEEEGEAA